MLAEKFLGKLRVERTSTDSCLTKSSKQNGYQTGIFWRESINGDVQKLLGRLLAPSLTYCKWNA